MTFRSLFLSATLIAFPSLSQALTLECNMASTNAGGGYVTDLYVLQYDDKSGDAIVADGLIMYYNKDQPMQAKVAQDNATKLVLTWSVQMTNSSGQTANMQFRASYFKADKSLLVRAVPGGDYSDNFEGRGKCKTTG